MKGETFGKYRDRAFIRNERRTMNYIGDLYGRVAGKFFKTGWNTAQVDAIIDENMKLRTELRVLKIELAHYRAAESKLCFKEGE